MPVKKIKKALRKLRGGKIQVDVKPIENLTSIGSSYGGWIIPENQINEKSVCYCLGAGEDISFDVGLSMTFKCDVFIFDPTPRAKTHFEKLSAHTKQGEDFIVNNNPNEKYNIDLEGLNRLHFNDIGIWKETGVQKFYVPEHSDHVSHSILNLHETKDYFEAKVDRLSNVIKANGHTSIDLLKIDIEGAEYEVLKTIIEDQLDVKIICVEYDEVNTPLDHNYHKRIQKSIDDLIAFGYQIYAIDNQENYYFIKSSLLLV